MRPPLRVVLTGAESSGKSTLAEFLAVKFRVPVAMEYARIHLERHGPGYDHDLVRELAKGHLASQRECVPEHTPVGIFDTDLINYKIWFDIAFGGCDPDFLAALAAETGHVYLICAPDIPWEPDPLREYPDDREMLFGRHLDEVRQTGRPYEIIRGVGGERESAAVAAFTRLTGLRPQ